MVFVSSVYNNYFVVNESTSAGVPCLGITDTDTFAQGCNLAAPGNDDSLDCVVFYHDLLAEYVLYRKFVHVYIWFMHIRRFKRLLNFYDWISLKYKKRQVFRLTTHFFFKNRLFNNRASLKQVAMKFFFGNGLWLDYVSNQVKIFRSHIYVNILDLVAKLEQSQSKRYFFSYFFLEKFLDYVVNFYCDVRGCAVKDACAIEEVLLCLYVKVRSGVFFRFVILSGIFDIFIA